jgi:hypothetical protein
MGSLHPWDVPEVSTHPSYPTVPTQSDGKFTLHPGDVPEVSTLPSSPTVPTQSDGKFILMTIDISLVHFFYNHTNFAVILCYGAVVSHL